jgi:hypothetical protein
VQQYFSLKESYLDTNSLCQATTERKRIREQACPKLAETFKEVNNEIKDKLDIVFVSWDENQADFDEYFKEMPWKALPFSGMFNISLQVK